MSTEMMRQTAGLLEKNMQSLAETAARGLDPQRFQRVALGAIRQNKALQKCSPASVVSAIMQSASLGLEPGSLGEAYLVPYGSECTFIPGYRGLVKLALQSGEVTDVSAEVVYESDHFRYERTQDGVIFEHSPDVWADDRGRLLGAYAIAALSNGERKVEVMSIQQIEAIRGRSRAANNGPWRTDHTEMCRKTVIRRIIKHLPLSTDAFRALEAAERSEFAGHATATQDRRATSIVARAVRYAAPEPAHEEEAPPEAAPVDADVIHDNWTEGS